jgi:hypothetical protein
MQLLEQQQPDHQPHRFGGPAFCTTIAGRRSFETSPRELFN